ncbi:unnamed protein product [Didymodactylos carnosus]|uniref:Riboflavin transporter n=1 Tax=Didymodactylos carnosus TaxID=1234261 RepID=A0A815DVG0_9BILA|nr:unnamed protein product [Didymodactylos carnosus]CAF1306365.1 unnamed protein product [Didymodactylos carnosus]CAF3621100.1 unnamed protein product [Didymodactylos carnosus]CAF4139901.1 unnamed protein product [Didymodactylos carnosus]
MVMTESNRCKHLSSSRAYKCCYGLIIILNLSTWMDINGLWIELPVMVQNTPEKWALPSTLALVISLGNIFPLIIILLRWWLRNRFTEIPVMYIIIVVGIIACTGIGFGWKIRMFVFGAERSICLIIAVFLLAALDCSSSLVFIDYMKRFHPSYLTAMFFGESLTAILPTFLALLQGVGGEIICRRNNSLTDQFEPFYSEPRFSVSIMFYLLSSIIACSLIAFLILRWTSVVYIADALPKLMANGYITDDNGEFLVNSDHKTPRRQSANLKTKQFFLLLFICIISASFIFGILPTLITYALLPYGQKAFYYCIILGPLAFPLAAFLSMKFPTVSTTRIVSGCITGCFGCIYIIIIAFQSPCPIMSDTVHGGVIIIGIWFVSSFIFGYVRMASANRIRRFWKGKSGLFWLGVAGQLGICLGVIPMYFIINTFNLLKDRQPCQTYCL